MKAKIELAFDLPEEKSNYEVTVHAMDFALVCWDLDNYLKFAIDNREQNLQPIRDKLHELMADRGVSLDMIE